MYILSTYRIYVHTERLRYVHAKWITTTCSYLNIYLQYVHTEYLQYVHAEYPQYVHTEYLQYSHTENLQYVRYIVPTVFTY